MRIDVLSATWVLLFVASPAKATEPIKMTLDSDGAKCEIRIPKAPSFQKSSGGKVDHLELTGKDDPRVLLGYYLGQYQAADGGLERIVRDDITNQVAYLNTTAGQEKFKPIHGGATAQLTNWKTSKLNGGRLAFRYNVEFRKDGKVTWQWFYRSVIQPLGANHYLWVYSHHKPRRNVASSPLLDSQEVTKLLNVQGKLKR